MTQEESKGGLERDSVSSFLFPFTPLTPLSSHLIPQVTSDYQCREEQKDKKVEPINFQRTLNFNSHLAQIWLILGEHGSRRLLIRKRKGLRTEGWISLGP